MLLITTTLSLLVINTCGWSTGFMATPLTLGQTFRNLLYLWNYLPALRIGFSVLPPPAINPTVALQSELSVFLVPDGNLTLVDAPSSECPIIVA